MGCWDWDLLSDRLTWTARSSQLLGISTDLLSGSNDIFNNCVHPDDRALVEATVKQAIETDGNYALEFRVVWQDGSVHWLADRGRVFYDETGRAIRMLGVAWKIDHYKQSELDLRLANERYELAAAAVNCLIYDFDLQRDRVERSSGLTELFGYTLEEAEPTAKWWHDLIHPDDLAQFDWNAMWESLATVDRFTEEYRVRHKNGHYVWVEERGFVVRDAAKPIRIVGCTTDISDRKQLEAEREELLAQAQAAREAAENANRNKDEFLAIVSHELRSPLNAIYGWTQLLRTRQFEPAIVERALETIERNTKFQLQLIEDLLDLSRMIRGNLKIAIAPVNLVMTIQTTVNSLRPSAEAKQIQLTVALPSQPLRVAGDLYRLQQIVSNLLTNAIKFTPEGGRVEIQLTQTETQAEIAVSDTGKGIAPEFLPYVFERFRQAENSTTRAKDGLGLGLAIVRHLVELHRGAIAADSLGEGQGATFTVRIPLLEDEVAQSQDGVKSSSSAEVSSLSGVKILVVDDVRDTLEFHAFALQTAGAIVQTASSARAAFERFQSFQPDLLLSDIGMPDEDGYSLLLRIRALEQGRQLRAIALTAFAKPEDRERSLRVGFVRHLTKPVEPAELVRIVVEVLRSQS
jgi:PAS domain S-box-containing protein